MKRLITLLLIVLICVGLAACSDAHDKLDAEQIEECGFVRIKQFGRYGAGASYLVYDPATKVEYIAITGSYGNFSLCPYYNEHGDVVIYEGD